MPRDAKPGVNSRRSLVRKILNNPHLPAWVEQLEPPALNRLIRYVGKEDAQELIVWATPEQVQELVEADAWGNDEPGSEESFDPDRFLDWLELFRDMGPAFLADKVTAIGADMFALALDTHVVVVDITTMGVTDSDYEYVVMETFAGFGVLPKDEERWPFVRELLTDVWDEDADFIESALTQCCQRRSLLAEKTHMAGNDTLAGDVAGNREDRRQRQGFVTPLSASVFLGEAKGTSIDELLIAVAYDPATAMHLREIRKPAVTDDENDGQSPASPSSTTPGPADEASDRFQELDALMEEAELLSNDRSRPAAVKLLEGPGERNEGLHVRRLLRELGERDPVALEARLSEIVYLGNILIAGTSAQGTAFSEAEAAKCAYATCNLGLRYCLDEEPFDDEEAMLESFLSRPPGMVKAFRIGYHLIGQLPFKAMVAMARELTTDRAQRRLRSHPWLQQQIGRDLALHDLHKGVSREHLGRVKEVLDLMMTVFDTSTCVQLRTVCDPFPCFPASLETDTGRQLTVNRSWRYIQDPGDLRRLLNWLEQLDVLG